MHWFSRHRLVVLAAICVFFTGLVLLLHLTPNVPFFSAVWSGETQFEDFFQKEARVQVKGKNEPVEIATLIGARDDATLDPDWLQHLETYEQAFQKFRNREFREAKILLSQFLEFFPNDYLAKMYLERVFEYEAAPPDEAWNAVEVFKKK